MEGMENLKSNDKYELWSHGEGNDAREESYTYNSDKDDVGIDIIFPKFLRFYCEMQSITGVVIAIDTEKETAERLGDYAYCFSYRPKLFGDGEYYFRVDDYSKVVVTYSNGSPSESGPVEHYYIYVDKDMNYISGDKIMYQEHYDELKILFDEVIGALGEDAFR